MYLLFVLNAKHEFCRNDMNENYMAQLSLVSAPRPNVVARPPITSRRVHLHRLYRQRTEVVTSDCVSQDRVRDRWD